MKQKYLLFFLSVFVFTVNSYSQNVDLSVSSISWSPENPMNGETVTFTATIINTGTDSVDSDFFVEFLVDGASISNLEEGVLVTQSVSGNNGIVLVEQDWVYTGGDFSVEVIADYGDLIVESGGENNNSLTEEFVITIEPSDYIVTDISWSPAYQYLDPFENKELVFTATIENQGTGGTAISSVVEFLIDGVSVHTTSPIGGLDAGENATVNYTYTVDEAGDFTVEVIADAGTHITESDETNNSLTETYNIDEFGLPDLVVTDISWLPEQPQEGETVTFYAQVENQGTGGTPTDYDIRFSLDGTELGITTIQNDIGFGQMTDAFSNAGFELNDWSNWATTTGFSLVSRESEQDGVYARSSSNGLLQSNNFEVTESILGFYAKSTASNFCTGCSYVSIRRASDNSTIETFQIGGNIWRYYTFNLSEYTGEQVYIYVRAASSSYTMSVDNFRMGSSPSSKLVVSVPTSTWNATVGTHTIKAEVDIPDDDIVESDETNQDYEEPFSVGQADYVVTDISWSPAYQYLDPFENKELVFTATIENQGTGGTAISSVVEFLIDGVSVHTTSPIGGLDAGENATVNYTYTVDEAGDFTVEVIADAGTHITESDETNNSLTETYNIDEFGLPDLVVTDISWLPEQPQEGETVTFYAQVENQGTGGTPTDYDIRFSLDGTELGITTIQNDIGFGQMTDAFSNAGFELNDWSNWATTTGFSLVSRESEQDGVYARSSSNGLLQSNNFEVTESILGFYAKSTASNFCTGCSYVSIRRASDNSTIETFQIGGNIWRYYTFNLSEYTGEQVYIYVRAASSSYTMSVDNFRMGSSPSSKLVVSVPTSTWNATVGTHTIKAEVDIPDDDIVESDETNQDYEEPFSVGQADYVVTDISWSPAYQYLDPFENKELVFTATIENQGTGGTAISSVVEFLIDGVSVHTTSPIGGLDAGENATVNYTYTVDEAGDFTVEVIADAGTHITESDETNNSLTETYNIDEFGLPDLVVTDISWLPEQPQEGETVTFYAQVENQGTGGTPTDYDIRFSLDGTELGITTIQNDIGFGQMTDAFSNAGFELNDWSNWATTTGFSLVSRESEQDGVYARSSSNGLLQSNNFEVTESILGFYAKSTASNFCTGCSYVSIRRASDNSTIETFQIGGNIWRYYTFNLSEYTGEQVYIYVRAASSSYTMSVDNFRMGSSPSSKLVVSVPTSTWNATVGTHTIKAEVDIPDDDIVESDETNQDYEEPFSVGQADYVVTDISWSPAYQYLDPFENKELVFTATIENQGTGGTAISSVVEFLIDGVSVHTTSPIGGLDAGENATVNYTYTVDEAGDFTVEVIADAGTHITESDETNNSLTETYNIDEFGLPDLVVTDISWLPEQPQEGETVTFYAQVENQGTGGTPTDYDIRFSLDGTELGITTIQNDIGFGQMTDAFSNAGFELNDWSNWATTTGFSLVSRESEQDGVYARSSSNGLLQSNNFEVTESILGFYAKSTASNFCTGCSYVSIRRASDNSTIETFQIGGNIWRYYTFNLSEYTGEQVYIYVRAASSSYTMSVDNFRMGSSPSSKLVVSVPTSTWNATVGTHTIKAEVDIPDDDIVESDETNQDYEEPFSVGQADYVVTDISWSPAYQYLDPFENKELVFTATIENQGTGGTAISSVVEFLIDGVSVHTTSPIGGLDAGENATVNYTYTVDEAGDFTVEVIADAGTHITESDETNNSLTETYNIDEFGLPDLVVTDISWLPEQPQEGETVTFYAQVENQGTGGTPTDYDIRFSLDGTELGITTIQNDIGFGQMTDAFSNAGFELNDWSNWATTTGFSLVSRESEQDGVYARSSSNGLLQSNNFEVTESILGFYAKSTASNFCTGCSYVSIRRASDNSTIETFQIGGNIWRYYTFNLSEYTGEQVYIYVRAASSSYTMSVDNFRMGSSPSSKLVVSVPTSTWNATVGTHTIKAEVDIPDDDIVESDETNQDYEEPFSVGQADYVVTDISWSPAYQYLDPFENKELVFTATIENQGTGGTAISSVVEFLIDGVSVHTTSPIGGLDAGENATVNYTYTVDEAGDFTVEVIADAGTHITESDETNNSLTETYNIDEFGLPDLVVTDISWLPEQPQEGETVTFYAQVENQGTGGTPTDYDIRFSLDGTELGITTIQNDIGFGQMTDAFSNAGFELNDWSNWATTTGFSLVSRESEQDGVYARSSSNGLLQSNNFEVTESILGFYAKSTASNFCTGCSYVSIRRASDNSTIETFQIGGNIWRYYTFNLSEYTGEQVYIYVRAASSSYTMSVDNFRMGSSPSSKLVVSVPTSTWNATVGTHTIKAEVDIPDDDIVESDETNQDYEEPFSVGQADYVVTDISWSPAYQYLDPFENKELVFTATIENQGTGGTAISSVVEFLIDGVSVHTTSPIGGLDAGENATVNYTYTVDEAGDFTVEVIADAGTHITESDETNNSLTETYNIDEFGLPDLVVTDISWLPEQPQEGETVTFYAQVENQGTGGTPTDYDIRFSLDGTELGITTIQNDIGFGQMTDAFSNAGFELNDWSNWATTTGFSLVSRESEQDGVYARSSSNGLLQSNNFEVTESILGFYAKSTASNFCTGCSYVSIRRASDNSTIETFQIGGNIWRYYTFNLSEYTGEQVYIYVRAASSSYTMSVDNFRMGSSPSSKLVVSVPTSTWNATVGTHTIKAEVDVNNDIVEAGGNNNSLTVTQNSTFINLNVIAYLQGASLNPYNGEVTLMRDDLRVNQYLPTISPYADNLECDSSIFTTTGPNAIVDWVWIELRDKTDGTTVVTSRSALLQADGDIVDIDGVSPLSIGIAPDDYYVAIAHRNHLGIMSQNSIAMQDSETPVLIDFTDGSTPTYGNNGQTFLSNGSLALWAGDVNGDNQVRYLGPSNDASAIKDKVLGDPGNTTNSNFYPYSAYDKADLNMDGQIRYLGPGNDTNLLKDIILSYPGNTSLSNFYLIMGQIQN